MAFVFEDRLLSLFDLPVQLPQTQVPAGGWLAVATVKLDEGQTLDLRWLQIYVAAVENVNANDPCGAVGRSVINPDFLPGSLAALFLIKDWVPGSDPWTQTVLETLLCPSDYALASDATVPIISVRNMTAPLQISTPGIYTFVILNNSVNRNVSITVDGAVTVDVDALQTT
jgi:hypothetical protein